jgi:hypothetical protein
MHHFKDMSSKLISNLTFKGHIYFGFSNTLVADPVAARSEARALITRILDRGFESRLRHGCLSSSFYVVLSCVGIGLATG